MRVGAGCRELLAIDVATLFVTAGSGRILHDNAPNRSTGPRLYLTGCKSGNVVRIRHDVGEMTARAIERIAGDEPPLCGPDSTPVHLDRYLQLLDAEAPVECCDAGLIWTFPEPMAYEHKEALAGSETPEGARLLARLRDQGMPPAMTALGFKRISDLWAPWCIALHEDEIASVAFSARLGPAGAETGVTTVPAFRGHGYAAAATAGWAALPSLRGRVLFYSTSRTNVSSQRVAQRLGLDFLGASMAIA